MAKALNGLLSDPSLRKALEVIADDAEPTSLAELLAWGKEHPPTVRIAGNAGKEASPATEGSEDTPQVCLCLFCSPTFQGCAQTENKPLYSNLWCTCLANCLKCRSSDVCEHIKSIAKSRVVLVSWAQEEMLHHSLSIALHSLGTIVVSGSRECVTTLKPKQCLSAFQVGVATQGKSTEGDSFGVDVEVVGEGKLLLT